MQDVFDTEGFKDMCHLQSMISYHGCDKFLLLLIEAFLICSARATNQNDILAKNKYNKTISILDQHIKDAKSVSYEQQ